jgi:hypothetical protein
MLASTLLSGACLAPEPQHDIEAPSGGVAQALRVERRTSPCDLVRCRSGFSCEVQDERAVCVPVQPRECKSDAECTLKADYCGGCNCLALAPGESAPKCDGDEVACFVSPCLGLSAYCSDGECVVDAAL